MFLGKNSEKLDAFVKKALEDHKLTHSEWVTIMKIIDEDMVIDMHERSVLQELQRMKEDGSIEIVKD